MVRTILRHPKVLHCVERMHTTAVESWLARMFHHGIAQGQPLDWYFHVQSNLPGALESTYPELCGRILRSKWPLSRWALFFAQFYKTCRTGQYDVVHIHADLMSAPYLVMARLAGIPRVIVHVHNADENVPVRLVIKANILRALFRRICIWNANSIVGISEHTLDAFLQGRKRRPRRDVVHYYGIDPSPFQKASIDRASFRRSLGLPEDALLLLFAARLVPEKNPLFAVDVLAELKRINPNVAGVFVGTGLEENAIIERAHQLGLADSFRALGWRADVPEIMNCCDWFILPRQEAPMEGLGVAVIEAQLAGLRLLLSLGIADDALLSTACVTRLPLAAGPRSWAQAAADLQARWKPNGGETFVALARSPFDMDFALRDLVALDELSPQQ